jgi:hypothetical protein
VLLRVRHASCVMRQGALLGLCSHGSRNEEAISANSKPATLTHDTSRITKMIPPRRIERDAPVLVNEPAAGRGLRDPAHHRGAHPC